MADNYTLTQVPQIALKPASIQAAAECLFKLGQERHWFDHDATQLEDIEAHTHIDIMTIAARILRHGLEVELAGDDK